MNKTDLELKISGLEKAIKEHDDFSATYQNDLKSTQKELEDIEKPELTPAYLDKIQEAVEEGVGNFSFDEVDNYDKEFGMEYDGKVHLESIDLTCSYELVEKIVDQVHKLFKEAEELDTTEADNHPVEKLQN
tara:strand:+ start:47 stop:442 length:396 start_codon:yes stop_codon:yes gene_type:complete